MLQSMTGYGKATCEHNSRKIIIEIRSLNGKSQDLNVKIASAYREKELDIRNKIIRRLERGKIEFSIIF
ncbi:MAG: hypothetical protein LBV75_08380, partial [Paludibacter sp.]|nr:hypothetical protein [Paludibacter sp.]